MRSFLVLYYNYLVDTVILMKFNINKSVWSEHSNAYSLLLLYFLQQSTVKEKHQCSEKLLVKFYLKWLETPFNYGKSVNLIWIEGNSWAFSYCIWWVQQRMIFFLLLFKGETTAIIILYKKKKKTNT